MRRTGLAQLIASSFPRPPGRGLSAAPRLSDFSLTNAANRSVTVTSVRCGPSGHEGSTQQPWSQAWFVLLGPDRLLMRIGTSALLTFAPRAPQTVPAPSFVCSLPLTAVEAILCTSVPLAALDQSVAAAFNRSLQRQSDAGAQLRAEQAQWKQMRDACGPNEACLAEAMRERIEELMQD
jgi:hypothetical protein